MPSFLSKVLKRDNAAKKSPVEPSQPQKPKWEDGWLRTEVAPEEVQELLRGCTREIKSRGLTTPFLILPYRPEQDPSAARPFIRNYFNPHSKPPTGEELKQELRLTEPEVLCSALKWCWSRLPGGVVTWDVYELFRQGEADSSMARDSFATFIPISAESEARAKIIFDYFDILSAIAAHAKNNGLGGMKLSRLGGWWAFEHNDTGFGFEGGYASWQAAADATCHLFFAYMRSLSPEDTNRSVTVLPTSLRALVASVDYPPVTPPQLQSPSMRVCLTVDKLAPSPFALIRRAKHHEYHPGNSALRIFTDYEDPVKALTDECRRVLKAIASQSTIKKVSAVPEQSWSRFQDIGFSGLLEDGSESEDDDALPSAELVRARKHLEAYNEATSPLSGSRGEIGVDIARPTTPSWADFMDGGFGEHAPRHSPAPLLLPPDKVLPRIEAQERVMSSASNRRGDLDLDPGDLEAVNPMDIDDAFWWVWMSSLAGEETAARKAVFGRCALVETNIKGCKWLIVEEKVHGAAKIEDSPLHKKDKKRYKLTLLRKKDHGRGETPTPEPMKQFNPSMSTMNRSNVAPEQSAKIQAAAAALRQQKANEGVKQVPLMAYNSRQNNDEPAYIPEAASAMKWASQYDKNTVREAYLQGKSLPAKPVSKPTSMVAEQEAAPPSPPALKDSPPLRPTSAVNNRHTMTPSTASTSGRSSPAPEKRRSLNASPKSQASPNNSNLALDKDGKAKVSKLRALFGKKEAEANQSPATLLSVPTGFDAARRPSLRRKQAPKPVTPVQTEPVTAAEPKLATPVPEEHEVQQAFNSFDQGPLDVPAFVPESPGISDEASKSNREVSKPIEPEAPKVSPPVSPVEAAPMQDRWAQIRKNAAERAKAAAAAPKQPETYPAVDATRTSIDDGETSSEEMLEARLEQAAVLKKVVDAIKDLVQDCNFDCNDSGIQLQAMDNSHVALVTMQLKTDAFSPYRCDRNIALGVNLASLQKVLRAAQNEDLLTLKAEDAPDVLNLVFENSENDRISEYDIKLMDIDQEHLGIPETEYAATVTMPSSEFQRICRDLSLLSESVAIEATKEGIKFSCAGDIGNGSVTLRSHSNVEDASKSTTIELQEPVALTFSLKYLVNFCKASGLSNTVSLSLSNEIPLLIEYKMESGHVRFYLAPKIGDEE